MKLQEDQANALLATLLDKQLWPQVFRTEAKEENGNITFNKYDYRFTMLFEETIRPEQMDELDEICHEYGCESQISNEVVKYPTRTQVRILYSLI